MKLCRFELKSAPGEVRNGIVYSGRVYETDGANAVAVHEAENVRPLAPIAHAQSIRFFRPIPAAASPLPGDEAPPLYTFGNPNTIIGPSQIVTIPESVVHADFEPYVAVVIATDGFNLTPLEAEDYILGVTILNVLVARDVERAEKQAGISGGRSHDIAAAIGPVITTPEELEGNLVDEERGKRYNLSVVARVNGVEKHRGNLEDLPYSFAELVAASSEMSPIRAGDIIAVGPIVTAEETIYLEADDEVTIAVENLGALSVKTTRT